LYARSHPCECAGLCN